MGSEDLFHKRKAKTSQNFKRNKASREPYEKVLIVCEGEKTEPHYFKEIRNYYRLNSANIAISGECGSDPMSVYRYAKKCYEIERHRGDAYDHVFCVFDKDAHANYHNALNAIENARPKGAYIAVTSIPCFEYWLLLHYLYTDRPYNQLPGRSAASQVLEDLRSYLLDYAKGNKDLFIRLFDRLEIAKSHAERALSSGRKNCTDNPSTLIHKLVEHLQNLR